MLISEIYKSRQGEGKLTGTDSVFVRSSGCNLRCDFCDTPFTSWNPEGETMTVERIVERIEALNAEHVVITGGEPMLQRDIVELTVELKNRGKHITMETAGTVFNEVECDLASISPKLSNSTPELSRAGEWRAKHESTRFQPKVIDEFIRRFDYQLKYVVAQESDLHEIQKQLETLATFAPSHVMLMPEGIDQAVLESRKEWLEPLCEKHGFKFCPRMHIQWYGNKRGT